MVSPGPSYELVASAESTDDLHQQPRSSPQRKSSPLLRHLALAAAFVFLAIASYSLGEWKGRTSALNDKSTTSAVSTPSSKAVDEDIATPTITPGESDPNKSMTGKYSVGYFVNWGIYGRKFPPSEIPAQDLTHILYAFANVKPDTGEVVLSDAWADQDIHYPGDSWNDSGTNLYGNFKAIYLLKKKHRHLKLLLSIGGWTYSPSFHPVVVNPTLRAGFVRSAVRILEDYGLDGLDVDYEYPQNEAQARGYVELLRELRTALDEHSRQKNADYRFLLTIAAPCGPDNRQKLHVREMDQFLDFWNMMAYDFAGSWDKVANHQANVFGGAISASQAIDWYISQGLPRHKIIMGIPLYGRSFLSTQGPGTPFNGLGQGSWESGVYDYRALPLPGAHVFRDDKLLASWSYDYNSQEMVSYDDDVVGNWKGGWITQQGLGGSMFWELSGDKQGHREGMEGGPGKEPQPGQSLVRVVKDAMGGIDLQQRNWLQYEGSKFENMRNGMP